MLYIRLSEREVILRNLLHLLSSLPASKGPFYIFISSFSTTNTTVVFYFNMTPTAVWYSALGAPPAPPNNIAPLYNQLVPIRTDRHVSIPERSTKFHRRPQLVCIVHYYTLLTRLQRPNLYVDAVTRKFIAMPTKQSFDKYNTVHIFTSCNFQYHSATYVVGSKSFRPDIQKPRQMENAVMDI